MSDGMLLASEGVPHLRAGQRRHKVHADGRVILLQVLCKRYHFELAWGKSERPCGESSCFDSELNQDLTNLITISLKLLGMI